MQQLWKMRVSTLRPQPTGGQNQEPRKMRLVRLGEKVIFEMNTQESRVNTMTVNAKIEYLFPLFIGNKPDNHSHMSNSVPQYQFDYDFGDFRRNYGTYRDPKRTCGTQSRMYARKKDASKNSKITPSIFACVYTFTAILYHFTIWRKYVSILLLSSRFFSIFLFCR